MGGGQRTKLYGIYSRRTEISWFKGQKPDIYANIEGMKMYFSLELMMHLISCLLNFTKSYKHQRGTLELVSFFFIDQMV